MNTKYMIQTVVMALATLAQNAHAADAAVPTPANQNAGLYRQLDELRSQNAILAETLKNAKLKNDINSVGTSPMGQPSMTPGGPSSYQGSVQPVAAAVLTAQVQMVSGQENNLTALIFLSNGGRVTVRVGSTIAGVGVVKSISKDEVMVAGKTQIISLPFALDATGVFSGAATSPMPPMPPMPQAMMPGGIR